MGAKLNFRLWKLSKKTHCVLGSFLISTDFPIPGQHNIQLSKQFLVFLSHLAQLSVNISIWQEFLCYTKPLDCLLLNDWFYHPDLDILELHLIFQVIYLVNLSHCQLLVILHWFASGPDILLWDTEIVT